MMKPTGKPLVLGLLLLLLQASPWSRAAVDASVDRHQVALGDTLQLIVSATEDNEDLSTVDLTRLQQDFQVLSRNTRSNTSIVNGQRSHNRQLQMEITPLRTGQLQIPTFMVGNKRTVPITVQVSDAPQIDPGSETVLFRAEVDRDSVYVQGQLVLTLRLQQAINLEDRSISELELPGAFVVPLEQNSFQRRVNGRPWLVHEVRYAIFPEQSGTLNIPAQSFSARESLQRRSLFDSSRGRLVRLHSEPISIDVLPRPKSFTASTWLPARNIEVEEQWSADPTGLTAGESVTRTVRIHGEGLQGAQLPPVGFPSVEGIKDYPDQPAITDSEIASGLQGSRTDSVAIVPTRPGKITLPAIEIPWWDTEAKVMRNAVIPARTLQVAPVASETFQPAAVGDATPAIAGQGRSPGTGANASALLWQMLTLACAVGWALTALLLLRNRRQGSEITAEATGNPSGKAAYKSLLAACATAQPALVRKSLIKWAAALADDPAVTSLEQAGTVLADSELSAELAALEQVLYGSGNTAEWQGERLRGIVERVHGEHRSRKRTDANSLDLYPTV